MISRRQRGYLLLTASTLAFLIVCSVAPGADWISLFNGHDLSGWTVRGGGATFEVEDGVIVGRTGPGHNTFLCTVQEFADFELEFEVQIIDPINSGVQMRSAVRPQMIDGRMREVVYGPQVEIEPSPGESGYLYAEKAGGWMTPKEKLVAHDLFKAGEWNRYRVVAEGPRIRTWINDTLVSDLTAEFLQRAHLRGFIALQVHRVPEGTAGTVAWRNLRVRELAATNNP